MAASDRIAIVTGTSSGIGLGVARLLVERGWDVVGVARRASPIDDPRYRHLALDLADLDAVTSAFEHDVASLVSDDRRKHVGLVNNAALIGRLGTLDGADVGEMRRVYAVNVIAPVWLMGFVARHAPRDSALRILNVSSGAAQRPTPGLGDYVGTKAALRMATLNAAADFESRPMRSKMSADAAVVSYSPGTVDTPMQVTARSQPADVFPAVTMFKGFHDQGMLAPAERPALEIVEFLESAHPPRVAERRIGEK